MTKSNLLNKRIFNLKIIKSKNPGKTSIVMAGVHGNEICGINAFKKIVPSLFIEKGIVIFVLGNPKAIDKNVRFVDFNLNRAFLFKNEYSNSVKKTYEYKRAQVLKKILDKGDALLDIHSTTNKSEPFVICEKNAMDIASFLPKEFKRVVSGFNSIEPGATDGYMIARGKIGIGIECGQHNNPKSIKLACNAIFSFLYKQGHLYSSKKQHKVKREKVEMNFIYNTKTNYFSLARKFFDFEKIKKGTVIGFDGKYKKIAPYDCVIVFAHDRQKKGEEAYLLGNNLQK